MHAISFDQLLEATLDLGSEQRQALAQVLHLSSSLSRTDDPLAEAEALSEAGAFSVFAPLLDVRPLTANITDADLVAATQCISCEWEEEQL